MEQGLLSWSHRHTTLPSLQLPTPLKPKIPKFNFSTITATLNSVEESPQTGRERRRMRSERRESKPAYNWKEEVEMRLIQKPTKRWANWKDELNLDTLADLGPQWWAVRVSRVTGQEIAERMARAMARNFPDMEFKVYVPSVQIKRKLKNGTLSIKPKPLFPGCVFLRCVLNKELHDFIRECPGVGGFVGSKVGNVRRQINKPKPVDKDDVEAMFKQAKEEQEKADQAFEEAEQEEKALDSKKIGIDSKKATKKPGGRGRKAGKTTSLKLGSTVQVSSGSFAGFSYSLKGLNPALLQEGSTSVYVPSVQIKRKLKNGTLSIKPKPLFPGCVFLRCALNKELHDFIRECPGVGGFVGSKVGNVRRQINKPKPVDKDDVEAMFKQAKEEQEKADQAFEEAEQEEKALDSKKLGIDSKKPGGRGRKAGKTTSLKLSSTVQVSSGSFAGFSGTLKKFDSKTGLATVEFTLFGKTTLADIDAKEIITEVNQN